MAASISAKSCRNAFKIFLTRFKRRFLGDAFLIEPGLFGVILPHEILLWLHVDHLDNLSQNGRVGGLPRSNDLFRRFNGNDGAIDQPSLFGQSFTLHARESASVSGPCFRSSLIS
jgi:hypothetical protein